MSEQEILQSLRKAIELDRNYFVKAKTDKKLDPLRSQVDRLLENISQETKTKVEQEISKAESMAKRMESWFKSEFSDINARDKYTSACEGIREAKRKLEGHGYFDYLDALRITRDVNEAFASAQPSIRDELYYSERELEECNNKLKHTDEEIRKNSNKFHTRLIVSLIAIIAPWIFSASGAYERGDWAVAVLMVLSWGFVIGLGSLFSRSYLWRYHSKIKDLEVIRIEKMKEVESLKQRILVSKKSIVSVI